MKKYNPALELFPGVAGGEHKVLVMREDHKGEFVNLEQLIIKLKRIVSQRRRDAKKPENSGPKAAILLSQADEINKLKKWVMKDETS